VDLKKVMKDAEGLRRQPGQMMVLNPKDVIALVGAVWVGLGALQCRENCPVCGDCENCDITKEINAVLGIEEK